MSVSIVHERSRKGDGLSRVAIADSMCRSCVGDSRSGEMRLDMFVQRPLICTVFGASGMEARVLGRPKRIGIVCVCIKMRLWIRKRDATGEP